MKLVTIDIEVKSENGFPSVQKCDEEMLLISLLDFSSKKILTFGVGPFENKNEDVTYIRCIDEYDMLQFLHTGNRTHRDYYRMELYIIRYTIPCKENHSIF